MSRTLTRTSLCYNCQMIDTIDKFIYLSPRYLFLAAFIFTLLSGVFQTKWGTGYIAGHGRGFPAAYWAINSWSDIGGKIPTNKQTINIPISLSGIAVDISFWTIALYFVKNSLLLIKQSDLRNRINKIAVSATLLATLYIMIVFRELLPRLVLGLSLLIIYIPQHLLFYR